VTERFRRGARLDRPGRRVDRTYKTLFRPRAYDRLGIHRPRFLTPPKADPAGEFWVDGSGRPIDTPEPGGFALPQRSMGTDLAVVMHYAVRSREEYLLKRRRGVAAFRRGGKERLDWAYWDAYNRNDVPVEDLPLPGLAAAMGDLMADPELAALHRAACAARHLPLRRLLREPAALGFLAAPGIVPARLAGGLRRRLRDAAGRGAARPG
jgi:hypothetical protein